MATEWIQPLSLSTDQRQEWERLSSVSGSGWWRANRGDIPSFVPPTMRPKVDGGLIVVSGSSSGMTCVVFSAERVDKGNLDIQPFGVFVFPSGALDPMALLHHGGWVGRTTPLPADFYSIASACSTGSYFFARPPEGKTSGTLEELADGHRQAFVRVVDYLKASGSSAA